MKLPGLLQLRILKEALRALFTGPATAPFPKRPHVPAERFRGRPKYYDEYCIGCGACFQVCPARAIEMIDSVAERKRHFRLHLDECIFCGQCQANCPPEKGVQLSREFDLACFSRDDCVEKVSKTLVICDQCGEIVGCWEQISWLAKKLGALAYSNPTLFLAYLKDLSLVKEAATSVRPEVTRADRLRILCPRCRREVVIKESTG